MNEIKVTMTKVEINENGYDGKPNGTSCASLWNYF